MNPRVVIPDSKISYSIGGPITIDQIEIGEVTIPSVQMNDFAGNFTYASSIAKDVEFEMSLSAHIVCDGNIDLPDPLGSYDTFGTMDLPEFAQKCSVGDIVMNGGSFMMNTPLMNLGPLSMKPDPIGDGNNQTSVLQTKADGIEMTCSEMQLENPLGVYIGSSFPIQNPMKPTNLAIEETSMTKLDSSNISSPPVTMRGIKALNIKIPSVTTGPFEISSDTQTKVETKRNIAKVNDILVDDDGHQVHTTNDADRINRMDSDLTLTITKITMRVKGGLEFKDLSGSVTTSSAVSDKFGMNLNLKGIKIKGLNICGMKIPEIMLEF